MTTTTTTNNTNVTTSSEITMPTEIVATTFVIVVLLVVVSPITVEIVDITASSTPVASSKKVAAKVSPALQPRNSSLLPTNSHTDNT